MDGIADPNGSVGGDGASGPGGCPCSDAAAAGTVDDSISDEDWFAAHGAIDPTAPTEAEEAARRLEVAGRMAEYEGYLARLAEREEERDEEGGR